LNIKKRRLRKFVDDEDVSSPIIDIPNSDIKSDFSSSSNWDPIEKDSDDDEETSEYESVESDLESKKESNHNSSDKEKNPENDTSDGDIEALFVF
jgi:hypothetical protein